jgi:hypothetical protein
MDRASSLQNFFPKFTIALNVYDPKRAFGTRYSRHGAPHLYDQKRRAIADATINVFRRLTFDPV